MKNFEQITYTDKIKWRIRILWIILAVMPVYMVVVVELGGGDSRVMTDLADAVSRILFFGGFLYLVSRLVHNKRLLKNRMLLKEQMLLEQDERNQYLHDKSGGLVLDVLLILLLFLTVTTALFDMAAFSVSIGILAAAVFLKVAAYLVFSRK